MSTLIEKLASLEHERWSGWMRYLFGMGVDNDDGSFTIDAPSVSRWRRQMRSLYEDLSEREKESDRQEVRKTIEVIENHLRWIDEYDALAVLRKYTVEGPR